MKRYILGLLVLVNFETHYISAAELDSAAVKILYTYTNDQASRAAGLVPVRLHRDVDEQPHTLTLNVHFYGVARTVKEMLDGVIDGLDLNEFATLHMRSSFGKVADSHAFTLEELRRIGTLSIDYIRAENTVERIKTRRISWMVDAIAGTHPHAWGDRAKRERIQALVEKNYFDNSGRPRSLRELQKIVNS